MFVLGYCRGCSFCCGAFSAVLRLPLSSYIRHIITLLFLWIMVFFVFYSVIDFSFRHNFSSGLIGSSDHSPHHHHHPRRLISLVLGQGTKIAYAFRCFIFGWRSTIVSDVLSYCCDVSHTQTNVRVRDDFLFFVRARRN